METVDFGIFHRDETSSRILDLIIPQPPASVPVAWGHKNTWAKDEFLRNADNTYRIKITITADGLAAGSYEDSFSVSIPHRNKAIFLIKFYVEEEPVSGVTRPDEIRPPLLVARPDKLNLGEIEDGDTVPVSLIVENIGGPVWDPLDVEWEDNTTGYATELEVEEPEGGKLCPITITFDIDTDGNSKGGTIKETLVVTSGDSVLKIPVTYKVIAWSPPRLDFSHKKIFCSVRAGMTRDVSIEITKTGARLDDIEMYWDNSDFEWHDEPVYNPPDPNAFPKQLILTLHSAGLTPGDYLDVLNLVTDEEAYEIQVVMRVTP